MIVFKTAKKYLGEYAIWERVDSVTQFKEVVIGGLFHIEESTVVNEKVTYLHIKVAMSDEIVKWNAAESRVVHENRRRATADDYEDEDEEDE